MNTTQQAFYVTGGTLRHDAPSYVERQADKDLLDGLLKGEFCYVLTSRQMGKSSLMVRTARKLREQGINVVALDLTAIGQNLTPEQWYDGLVVRMSEQLRLEDELESFWRQNTHLSPVQRFFSSIRDVILRRRPGPFVVFVDELDVVRSLPFSTDEFFAAVRECYTRRTEDEEFRRVTFCLLGVATATDLIRDTRITPFNIGRRIELSDFTELEAAPLAGGLVPPGPQAALASRAVLDRILYWTHGHPYLTQRVCRTVSEQAVTTRAGVDKVCAELLLTPAARERDDNLLFVRESILRSDADRMSLLNLYGRIHRGRKVKWDEANPLLAVLRLSGLVRVEKGRVHIRNRIYERVFDRQWIVTHMPGAERQRQRRAFRLGLATALGSVAVLFAAALIWRRYLDQDPPITFSRPPPPGTNAFYLYQAAGRLIRRYELDALSYEPANNTPAALEEVLRLNTNVLKLVRIGFQYPCLFPAVPWSEIQKDYAALNTVSRLLMLEGELHERRGEWSEAARSYLDNIRLAQDFSRAAPIPIFWRRAMEIHIGKGGGALARLLPRLDASLSRSIKREIDGILHDTADFTEILKQEKIILQTDFLAEFKRANWRYEAPMFPESESQDFLVWWFLPDDKWEKLRHDFVSWLFSWIHSKRFLVRHGVEFYDDWVEFVSRVSIPPLGEEGVPEAPIDPFLQRLLSSNTVLICWRSHLYSLTYLRLLKTAAALHIFRLERGTLPGSLDELVPAFLDQVPHDPFSPEQPLKYRLNDNKVLLYSVGLNGKDDGGVPTSLTETNKDDIILRDLDLKN